MRGYWSEKIAQKMFFFSWVVWAAQFPSTVEGRLVDFYDIMLVFFVWITLGLQFYAFCECCVYVCVCEWRQFSFSPPLFRLFEGYIFAPTTHREVRGNKFIRRPISGCCFFGVYFLASSNSFLHDTISLDFTSSSVAVAAN